MESTKTKPNMLAWTHLGMRAELLRAYTGWGLIPFWELADAGDYEAAKEYLDRKADELREIFPQIPQWL